MGQTLSHGVYLPNEGERNCYAGLASNWQILNTAVGNIAEKAPLVHTHGNITNDGKVGTTANLPLITGTGGAVQAGSFGNQANTFCEGNDSRLSDARTPVAHTHGKSDVTDLLNSNFIPSANNSYDLGSSSYQWNNLYAKNYYYNGVAWGLDKANTWSGSNTFTNGFTLKNTSWSGKTPPSGTKTINILLSNSDTIQSKVLSRTNANSSETWITTIRNIDANTSYESTLIHAVDNNGNRKLQPLYGDVALGASDSGSRFKTLNGVNPGALSLPDMGNVENTNYFDFSGSITHLDGTDNFYTPTTDGWMTVIITGTSLSLFADASSGQAKNQGVGISAAPVNGFCLATIPVRKNYRVKIQATGTSIYMAFVRPNLGNV